MFKNNFKKYEDKTFDLLKKLISYPTILDKYNSNSDIPFGKELNNCLNFMLNYAKEDGFKVYNANNYAGHIEYGEGEEILGILAHLDVVPVNESEWDSNPFELSIRDNKLYARGIMDDKGPFVASYIALKMIKDLNIIPNKKIRLIFGLDEESGSRCVEEYFKHMPKPDLAFSPDAEFPLINGEKGIISYDILVNDNIISYFKSGTRYNIVPSYAEMKLNIDLKKEFINYLKDNNYNGKIEDDKYIAYGIAAHAMCPEKGLNAAYILFDFLNKYSDSKLAKFIDKYFLFDVYGKKANYYNNDPIMKELTSNFAIVDISNYSGKFGVNCRCPLNDDFNKIEKSLINITKEYNYDYKIIDKSNSHYVDSNSFLVTSLMKSYMAFTNDYINKPMTIGGGTYARYIDNAVAFGPLFVGREDVCHIANEYMYLDDFYKLIEIYFNAILELIK